jgi:hypothetical protein
MGAERAAIRAEQDGQPTHRAKQHAEPEPGCASAAVVADRGADKPDAKAARKAAEKAAKRERKAASAERR